MNRPSPSSIDALVRQHGDRALPDLARLLVSPDERERLAAARWLGDVPTMGRVGPAAVKMLAPVVRDPAEAVALAALQGIGALGTEADIWRFCAPLVDAPNVKVAAAALECLRRFPSPRAAHLLETKLWQGPNVLRFAVLSAIEAAADDAFVKPLIAALGHPLLPVRNRAVEVTASIARTGKVELGRTLVWLLRSQDVNVRRAAAEVVRSVPDPNGELWPKLVASLRDDDWWVRERVMDALVELAGHGLSSYMVHWLADGSDVVRRFALSVLGRLRDPETIGALVHVAKNDPDWWVREKAIEVIAEFKDARAVPLLAEILHASPELAVAAISALKSIDPIASAPHIVGQLDAKDPDVRLAALAAIEATNDVSLTSAVAPLRNDANAQVAHAAQQVVARFKAVRAPDATAPIPRSATPSDSSPLDLLLLHAIERSADEVIIACERAAFAKAESGVVALTERPLASEHVAAMLTPLLSAAQATRLEHKQDVDMSYVVKSTGQRFRVSVFRQRGGLSAVFRSVGTSAPLLEDLALPAAVAELCDKKNGLVVLAGPARSGKSTTLAALLDHLNRTRSVHIVSIEDPIEVLHAQHVALVNQREVGTHTRSANAALRSALRQDPDVLLLGEMRDAETIRLAITAAETGHLVFGTLQTTSSDQAVERMLGAFPGEKVDTARAAVADVLRAVVCQCLVRTKDHSSKRVAVEVLINTDAVANLIRKGKTVQIPSLIATSGEQGMQSLEQDLHKLIQQGLVDADDAARFLKGKREPTAP
jgi:twitching motility protein PilT